jgi:histone H1/5
MLKKISALLTRKPFPAPKEEIMEIVSLSEPLKKPTLKKPTLKKPTLKKATTRKPAAKKVVAKVATKVAKKKTKPKNVG